MRFIVTSTICHMRKLPKSVYKSNKIRKLLLNRISYSGCKHAHREKVMLRAADAIILDENFGPKAKEEKEKMPALHSTNLWVHRFILLFDCDQIDKKVGHLFLSIKGRSLNVLRRCRFNLESRGGILSVLVFYLNSRYLG